MSRLLCIIITSLFTLAPAQARSFGWVQFFSADLEKTLIGTSEGDPALALTKEFASKAQLQEIEKQLSEKKGEWDAKAKSDYAGVLLLLHGPAAAEQAIEQLKNAEVEMPGQYIIAINAATALELGNFYAEAGDWLAEARRRNSQPHLGSEWLQALIVQAKEQLQADPEWLFENSVLGVDFGDGDMPIWPKVADKLKWSQITKLALFNQLRGRLRFANPPDPIIADLLFDFANLQSLTGHPDVAAKLYEQALTFQPAHRQLVEKRLTYIKTKQANQETRGELGRLWIGTAVILFLATLTMLWVRHKKLRKNKALPKS